MHALIRTTTINSSSPAPSGADNFTGWHCGDWWERHLTSRQTQQVRQCSESEEQLRREFFKGCAHEKLSCSEVVALTTGLRDGSCGSPPLFLIAVQNLLDFGVSACYSEEEPTPVTWWMRTQSKKPLSGGGLWSEGAIYRGVVSLSQRCCNARLLICTFLLWFYMAYQTRLSKFCVSPVVLLE